MTGRAPHGKAAAVSVVFDVVLPIFGLIFTGWLAAKRGLLPAAATPALNRFVMYFALPPLLFLVMLKVPLDQLFDGPFLGTYLTTLGLTFIIALLWAALVLRQRFADQVVQAVGASYANVGYMGVPLITLAFGAEFLPQVVVAMVITAAVLFGVGILLIEAATRADQGLGHMLAGVGKTLITNPTIIAPILGGIWAASGVPLPASLRVFAELLGAAASPCALFALGLFIATQPVKEDLESVAWLVMAKLLLQPLLCAVIAFGLFGLDGKAAAVCILLNALPIGAGTFVLAQAYETQVAQASAAILVSTVLSILTVSTLLIVYGVG